MTNFLHVFTPIILIVDFTGILGIMIYILISDAF